MRKNPAAMAQLPTVAKGRVEAFLSEYDINEQGAKLWHFLLPPQSLSYSRAAAYNEQATLGAKVNDWQYSSTGGQKLVIQNLIMQTFCEGRSLQPLLDGLNRLMEAKTADASYAPPVLLFSMGSKRFGPCVLFDIQYDEVAWLGGDPARLQLSITLQELPKPPNVGTPTEPAADTLALAKQADGKPRKALTLRQRQDGSTRALAWLQTNQATLPESLRAIVSASAFTLATDSEAGDIAIAASDGTALGTVARWDGRTFLVENVQEFR